MGRNQHDFLDQLNNWLWWNDWSDRWDCPDSVHLEGSNSQRSWWRIGWMSRQWTGRKLWAARPKASVACTLSWRLVTGDKLVGSSPGHHLHEWSEWGGRAHLASLQMTQNWKGWLIPKEQFYKMQSPAAGEELSLTSAQADFWPAGEQSCKKGSVDQGEHQADHEPAAGPCSKGQRYPGLH